MGVAGCGLFSQKPIWQSGRLVILVTSDRYSDKIVIFVYILNIDRYQLYIPGHLTQVLTDWLSSVYTHIKFYSPKLLLYVGDLSNQCHIFMNYINPLCSGENTSKVSSSNYEKYRTKRTVQAWPLCSPLCGIGKAHYDVIKWKYCSPYWPFVRRIHRSPVNSRHKVQWRVFFDLRLNKRLSK